MGYYYLRYVNYSGIAAFCTFVALWPCWVSVVMLEVVLSTFVVSHLPLEQQVWIRKVESLVTKWVGMRQMLIMTEQWRHNGQCFRGVEATLLN